MSNDLLDRRAAVWGEYRSLLTDTEGRDLSAEETLKFSRMDAELDRLTKALDSESRMQTTTSNTTANITMGGPLVITSSSSATEQRDVYGQAFTNVLRYGIDRLESEQRDALQSEYRAQSVGTTTAGGFLAPATFRAEFVTALKSFGGMREAARVITTSTGEAMNIPTVDETNVVGAILAENTQMAEQDVAIGQKSIGSFMWTSKLVRASLQFVEDAAIDVESWLRGILAARIGRAQNAKFTNGAGTTEPLGIVTGRDTAKDVTSTGATAGTVAYVDLVNAVGKIDPAYRAMPGMAWMLHDAVVGNFRKILDSSGRPIWSPSTSGLTGGAEDRLLGYPIIVNQDLDATPTTAADVIALVGNFKESYLVRDTNDLRVLVLSERYADYLQRGYTAFQRSDGTVINTAAYAAIIE